MTCRWATAAVCAVAGLLSAQSASAACTVQALPLPVTMKGLRPVVTAKINGQDVQLLLDSGSARNAISTKLADAQKMPPLTVRPTDGHLPAVATIDMSDVSGRVKKSHLVVASQLDFLGTMFKNVPFLTFEQLDYDGLLGQPMLSQFDGEYDLGNGVVRLVKPNGCENTDIVYWTKAGAAYSKVPLELFDRNNPRTISGSVLVNGVKMRAIFDTGAALSFITEKAAARAGVKLTDPGVRSAGTRRGINGDYAAAVGTFAYVQIGDEEIKNAPLTIGWSREDTFDMLIGADFFMSHHVYVANSQRQIYFAYNGGPVFLTAPSP